MRLASGDDDIHLLNTLVRVISQSHLVLILDELTDNEVSRGLEKCERENDSKHELRGREEAGLDMSFHKARRFWKDTRRLS